MNNDKVKGNVGDAKGSVKKSVGKATGDDKLQAEGALGKAAGAVQKGVGEVKDRAKRVVNRIKK